MNGHWERARRGYVYRAAEVGAERRSLAPASRAAIATGRRPTLDRDRDGDGVPNAATAIPTTRVGRDAARRRPAQKPEPGCLRKAISSAVDWRPRIVVAVREAAEALDHRAMPMRVVEHRRLLGRFADEPREQADRLVLHRQALRHARTAGRRIARMNGGSASSWRAPTIRLAAASARASPANARARAAKGVARELVEQEDLRQRTGAASSAQASSSPRSARSIERAEALADRRVERGVLGEPGLARAAVLGAAGRAEPEVEDRVGRRWRGGRSSRLAPTSRRGWISTERSPSATQTMPSCRLTCSCMLRCASAASAAALLGRRSATPSTLPARVDRGREAGPPGRRAVAEGVDADAVGAAARLDEAALLGLADLDPVDDAGRSGPSARARARRDPTCPWRTRACRAWSSAGTLSANASSRTIIRSSVSDGWRARVTRVVARRRARSMSASCTAALQMVAFLGHRPTVPQHARQSPLRTATRHRP